LSEAKAKTKTMIKIKIMIMINSLFSGSCLPHSGWRGPAIEATAEGGGSYARVLALLDLIEATAERSLPATRRRMSDGCILLE